MPLKVAVQMDHISTVSIAGDTSFALSLEAQRRGHRAVPLHARPAVAAGQPGVGRGSSRCRCATCRGDHFTLGEPVPTDLSEMDVVLLGRTRPST